MDHTTNYSMVLQTQMTKLKLIWNTFYEDPAPLKNCSARKDAREEGDQQQSEWTKLQQ